MRASLRPRMRAASAMSAAVVLLAAAPCRAGDGDAAKPKLTAAERALAVRLFDEASAEYQVGRYDRAIPLFQRAYDIAREPTLIFNLAQAYRLSGDCRHALASYEQFLGAPAQEPMRVTAAAHAELLRQACGDKPAVAAPVAVGKDELPAPEGGRRWRNLALVGVGTGLLAGAAATALYVWNGSRFETWSTEDRRLMAKEPGNPAESARRQDANDDLWRSIHQTDRAALALAVAGATLTVAGGALWFWSGRRERPASLSFTGTAIAARFTWR
jgi:tetratricopeptide (TPR) repeat protein